MLRGCNPSSTVKKSQLKDIFIYKCEEGRYESKY